MKIKFFSLLTLICAANLCAQEVRRNSAYEEYIAQWRDVAQEHEVLYGIPASISLAQGLLESNAGQSELAVNAHNHFGIKCTSDWMGGSYYYDDDQKGECFRVYGDAARSWSDHARFLQRDRYKACFDFPVSDYASWARQLKACGYATDPAYPQKLIRIIETYELASAPAVSESAPAVAATAAVATSAATTSAATSSSTQPEETDDFFKGGVVVPQPEIKPMSAYDERKNFFRSHPKQKANGHHYIIAKQGETYATIAFALNVKERSLRMWNDALGRDLHPGDRVYYMGYKKPWLSDDAKAIMWVHPGESVWQISQREGIPEKKIRKLNGFTDAVDIFKTRQQIILKKQKTQQQ